jgi:hypothetical protein
MNNPTISNQQTLISGRGVKLSTFTQKGKTLTVIELLNSAATPLPDGKLKPGQALILDAAELAELRQHFQATEPGPPVDPVGKVITTIRALRPQELDDLDWPEPYPVLSCPVLVLNDGTLLYPVQDEEGNGPGCLWGRRPDGQDVTILLEVE